MKAKKMNDQERFNMVCSPKLDNIEHNVDKILSILIGNGEGGIVSHVQILEEQVAANKDTLNNLLKWFIGAITSTIVTLIAAGIIALIAHSK